MRILITRELKNKSSYLNQLPEETELDAISFIEIEYLPFDLPYDISWIFFSSRNGFDSFISQHNVPKNAHLGCVSEGTEKHIKGKGFNVQFCGDPFKSTLENARLFSKVATGKIFFPSSIQSLSTFTKFLDSRQIIEKAAYRTIEKPRKLNNRYSFYCFTSPSNVRGFFGKNNLPESSFCIAIGSSTKSELNKYVTKNAIHVAKHSSIDGIFEEIQRLT